MNCVWAPCANSNITCRYWATSGTCFFGDQCNFAHNAADRAASGKSGVHISVLLCSSSCQAFHPVFWVLLIPQILIVVQLLRASLLYLILHL